MFRWDLNSLHLVDGKQPGAESLDEETKNRVNWLRSIKAADMKHIFEDGGEISIWICICNCTEMLRCKSM